MKVLIAGATGAIGGRILQHVLHRSDITQVIALTRKPLPENDSLPDKRVETIIINDFGDLESVQNETWEKIQDADAMIWAMGTYNLNEDVNLKYPLAFQEHLAKRILASPGVQKRREKAKFKFILLSGAFVEPDQSRWLYFLGDQRRMKGVLQTKTIELAQSHSELWDAFVIRPGGIILGGDTYVNKATEYLFGSSLAIRGDELGAFVADLVVHGSQQTVIQNSDMVERGRKLLYETS
ncbi:hypothetical protein BKA66DRAFT_467846 [Pyrenochaeta sp. MPI-SDFR-AT-0127]|nr:hypothetical protein BKA66DRAFT_467846 [Pyrenochaeta sp. MPI-SDFR-AT-0127]